MQLEPFLTAYDPTDLPAGSVDPLGFDRGYTWLADKILPGLTNVASQPRYLSVLCASIHLADEFRGGGSVRERERVRRETVLSVERYWALGCLLVAREAGRDTTSVRGINYVKAAAAKLDDTGAKGTRADYRLLSRQATYGMLGIYTSVAENLRLLRDDAFALSADLGPRLAQAFIAETGLSENGLGRAMALGEEVSLKRLLAWAERAQVSALPESKESTVLQEAVVARDVRRRMVALLAKHSARDGEAEMDRLGRVLGVLATTDQDADLREALRTIVAFEQSFREVVTVLMRLVWKCQSAPPFAVALGEIEQDPVISAVLPPLARAVRELDTALEEGRTPAFRDGIGRIADARAFLREAAAATRPAELAIAVTKRHRDVQRAKLTRGQPKMPWIELRDDQIVPTLAAAQRVDRPPTGPGDVAPHPYRIFAADQLARHGGLA